MAMKYLARVLKGVQRLYHQVLNVKINTAIPVDNIAVC